MAICSVCSTKRASRMSRTISAGRASVRSSWTQVSMMASFCARRSGSVTVPGRGGADGARGGGVAREEQHTIPEDAMDRARRRRVQDDDLDRAVHEVLDPAFEIERQPLERGGGGGGGGRGRGP